MKWQKERDELIAQTKAFVQSVTGRTPQTAPPGNHLAAPVLAPVSPPPLPIEQVEPMIDLRPKAPALSDVRKEIETRVAAFQAHQHRFHRERDAYFNSVLTKARSAIKDGPDVPSS
jgi:hypothetical protein